MHWVDAFRRFTINALFVLLLFFALAVFTGQPKLPQDAALIVDPSGAIVEELDIPSPGLMELGSVSPKQTRLHDLTAAIRAAASDVNIRLMVLKLDEMDSAPLPALEEIRSAIGTFRDIGKMVIAVGSNYSQSQYYLAAAADHIFLDPLGVVALEGFSIYRNYFGEALDRLNVDIQLFRAGHYKAAAEPLVRSSMSDVDREASSALVRVAWSQYKEALAAMRGVKAERIQQILDAPSHYLAEHQGNLAALAKAEGLVDELARQETVEQYIAGAMGSEDGDYDAIDFRSYLNMVDHEEPGGGIGIVTVSGMILGGDQLPGTADISSTLKMLEHARKDDSIKAVVLRIDCPGGSAQAAAAIRDEIQRIQAAGKPVVASMANIAASGGYWVAAPADEIWAAPATITGSIGVFGVLPNFERMLESLGVYSDGVGTTSVAGGLRGDRSISPEVKAVVEQSVDHVYGRFVSSVAVDRNMERERVEALAGGRAWSGVDAERQGLVDHLGRFDEAVAAAARLAGVERYGKVWITPPMALRDMILTQLFGSTDGRLGQLLGAMDVALLQSWHEPIDHYVRMLSSQGTVFALSDVRMAP